MKMRVPYGTGSHIHPAAIRAKVDGDTDNVNLHKRLHEY
jgi:hypothetical protein